MRRECEREGKLKERVDDESKTMEGKRQLPSLFEVSREASERVSAS
jgi:hypothetical protein